MILMSIYESDFGSCWRIQYKIYQFRLAFVYRLCTFCLAACFGAEIQFFFCSLHLEFIFIIWLEHVCTVHKVNRSSFIN